MIEMMPGRGLVHAPGVVAVLDAFPVPDPDVYLGRVATIRQADGRTRLASIEATRWHRVTISFFFRNLTPADVPIGCTISLEP